MDMDEHNVKIVTQNIREFKGESGTFYVLRLKFKSEDSRGNIIKNSIDLYSDNKEDLKILKEAN